MFEKGQTTEIRKLGLGPKSLISTFQVVLLLAIRYSNNTLMGLQNLFTKLQMSKKKPTLCQSYSQILVSTLKW